MWISIYLNIFILHTDNAFELDMIHGTDNIYHSHILLLLTCAFVFFIHSSFIHCSFHIRLNYLKSTFIQRNCAMAHTTFKRLRELIRIEFRRCALSIPFRLSQMVCFVPRVRFEHSRERKNTSKTQMCEHCALAEFNMKCTCWKFLIILAKMEKVKENNADTETKCTKHTEKKVVIDDFMNLFPNHRHAPRCQPSQCCWNLSSNVYAAQSCTKNQKKRNNHTLEKKVTLL